MVYSWKRKNTLLSLRKAISTFRYSFKMWDYINTYMPLIYKITNTITNKKYIGFTSKTLESRWKQHVHQALVQNTKTYFYNAIRKYGESNWVCEILEEGDDYEYMLKTREGYHIAKYDKSELYNTLLFGGMGGITSTCFKKGCASHSKGKKMPLISEKRKEYWKKWKEENPNYKDKWKKRERTGISDEDRIDRSKRVSENNKVQAECPHCKKIGQRTNMIRWHFDNCKHKK
jgi:group I intron endonuclease